jgi:uncharacterized membrane protein
MLCSGSRPGSPSGSLSAPRSGRAAWRPRAAPRRGAPEPPRRGSSPTWRRCSPGSESSSAGSSPTCCTAKRASRDVNAEFEQQLTFGERLADRIAVFGGSWGFISVFVAMLVAWIAYNVERPAGFDPYPLILLNLVLSCLAALQAPVIMMSQNRMAAKDRLDARHDYEINLKAEMEITQLHAKLDELQHLIGRIRPAD